MENKLTYTIQVEREEDGNYIVSVPALPGCFTYGRSLEEAIMMAQDAIVAFVTVLARRGKRIPAPKKTTSPFAISVGVPSLSL